MITPSPLTPRKIAIILGTSFVVLAIALYEPLRLVFAGEWLLQQQFNWFNFKSLPPFDNEIFRDLPIGMISFRFYSLLMLGGILAGYALTTFLAKFHFIASTIIDRLLIGVLVSGLIGARILYVAFNWDKFASDPFNVILSIQQGGLAIFGGFIGAGIYLFMYTKQFRFNFWEFLDIITPGVLLGQIIARWGNFFNYEAYGPSTSVFWKMTVPDKANITSNIFHRFFHPTFLYEIIPNCFLLVGMLFVYTRLTRKRSGLIFALWAIGYGIIRFFTEFWRLDALKLPLPFGINYGVFEYPNLLVSQFLALVLIGLGLATYYYRSRVFFNKKGLQEIK
jgi:phosphatidylglycerol---prolipoprotein diacylglyceryl transferase